MNSKWKVQNANFKIYRSSFAVTLIWQMILTNGLRFTVARRNEHLNLSEYTKLREGTVLPQEAPHPRVGVQTLVMHILTQDEILGFN